MSKLATQSYTPGTQKDVRAAGRVPAVVYGPNTDPQPVSLDLQDFRRAFRSAGRATLIDLEIGGKEVPCLVQDIQQHPVTDTVIHIDFFAVDMNKPVTATVPIKFTGAAPAVRLLGGILTTSHEFVHVRCLPKQLTHHIEVSVDGLTRFHDVITLADITLPEGMEMLDGTDIAIAQIAKPRGAIEADIEDESADASESSDSND